jgi:hypothetical protein
MSDETMMNATMMLEQIVFSTGQVVRVHSSFTAAGEAIDTTPSIISRLVDGDLESFRGWTFRRVVPAVATTTTTTTAISTIQPSQVVVVEEIPLDAATAATGEQVVVAAALPTSPLGSLTATATATTSSLVVGNLETSTVDADHPLLPPQVDNAFNEPTRRDYSRASQMVVQIDALTGQDVAEHASMREAERSLGISNGKVGKIVNSQHTAKGWKFRLSPVVTAPPSFPTTAMASRDADVMAQQDDVIEQLTIQVALRESELQDLRLEEEVSRRQGLAERAAELRRSEMEQLDAGLDRLAAKVNAAIAKQRSSSSSSSSSSWWERTSTLPPAERPSKPGAD